MSLYITQIKKNKNKIQLESEIIDNSDTHRNHKSFQKGKLHLILKSNQNYLNKLRRLEAEKILMKIFKDNFKINYILEIRLK